NLNTSYSGSTSSSNHNSIKNTKSVENIHQKQQIIQDNLLEKMKVTKSSLGKAIENFSKNVRSQSNLRENWNRESSHSGNNGGSFQNSRAPCTYRDPQEESYMRAKTPLLARTDDGREVLLDFRKMKKNF